MIASLFHKLMQAVVLLAVQGLVLNHVSILGYGTPMPYLYFLLTFRKNANRNELIIYGFLLGLIADLFTNTPGISAASCTFMGFIQPYLLAFLTPRDGAEDLYPSYATMGVGSFVNYLFVSALFFQMAYYLIAIFSLAHPSDVLFNILGGTLFTCVLMLGIAGLHKKQNERF